MIYLAAAAALALVGGLLVAGSALLQRRRARPAPPAPVARVEHLAEDEAGEDEAGVVLVARGLPPVPPPGRHRRHDTGDELTMTGFMRVLDARTVAAETRLAEAVTAEHATTR